MQVRRPLRPLSGRSCVRAQYPEAGWNARQEQRLRANLYKALRPLVGAGKMVEAANTLLRVQRL